MSYFKANIGPPTGEKQQTDKHQAPSNRQSVERQKPHFAAELGQRPAEPATPRPAATSPVRPVTCPLCGGQLLAKDGLYLCQDRCQTHWLADATGHLVDLVTLPFGVCTCCTPPQALLRSNQNAICPISSEVYLLLPDGPALLAEAAPHGLCQCCQPAIPLVVQNNQLVCGAKPFNQYEKHGEQITRLSTTPASPSDVLDAIDEALRRNTAQLTVNGLFDLS